MDDMNMYLIVDGGLAIRWTGVVLQVSPYSDCQNFVFCC